LKKSGADKTSAPDFIVFVCFFMIFCDFTYQNKISVLHFHGKMLWNKLAFMLEKLPMFSLH